MAYDETYETLHRDLLPVFLGSNRTSHRLAAVLFRRYGTVSVIADHRRTLRDLFNPATTFFALPSLEEPRLVAELLLELVGKDRDAFPLLIPCTEEYKTMVAKEAESLESRFILSEDTALLEHSPIADFPREGGVLR